MPSARAVRWAQMRVAVLAVAAVAILSVLVYLLSGGTLFRPKTTLRIYVPDASGLAPGAPVRLNGILVGKIRSVRLSGSADPRRVVEVRMAIEENYVRQIPRDSVSMTAADNLLGDLFIDITKGKSPQSAPPGGEIPFQPAPDLMKQIDIEQFEDRMRAIDQFLADLQAGKSAFGQFLISDDLYRQTVERVAGLQNDLHAALSATGSVGQLVYQDTAHRDLSTQLRQLDERLAEVQDSAFMKDPAQYEEWRARIGDLRQGLNRLKETPWLKDDVMHRQWSKGLAALIESVDAFNMGQGAGRMLTDPQPYESLNGSLRELEQSVREFRADPRKFLRIRFKLF